MKKTEYPATEVAADIKKPIDLRDVDKEQFVFYLTKRAPVAVSEFAEECTQNEQRLKKILRDRFRAEINIDATDFVQLTGDARRPVIKAGKPFVRDGRELLKQGKSQFDDGNYEEAVNQFKKAVSTLELIQNRFAAVEYKPKKLRQLITAAKQHHDLAAKEAAKDTINYQVLKTTQHESDGDSHVENNTSKALDEYQEARDALSKAVDAAQEYNQSKLQSGQSDLSLKPLEEKQNKIKEKIQSFSGTHESSEKSANTRPEQTKREKQADDGLESAGDSGAVNSHSKLRDIASGIESLGRASLVQLEWAGYESLADLSHVSKGELTEVDKIGPKTAEKLLSYAEQSGVKIGSAKPAKQSKPASELTADELKARLEKYYESDESEGGNWYRCCRITDGDTVCNTKVYFSMNNSSDLVSHEASHKGSKKPEDVVQQKREELTSKAGTQKQKDGESSRTEHSDRSLDQGAFENSWETIPDNSRINGQFLGKVEDVKTPRGEKKSNVLSLVDRTGTRIKLDIWKTHNLNIEWKEGVWYALSEVRGSVWKNKKGKTRKRLSSTKDLEVINLGSDFDYEQVSTTEPGFTVEPVGSETSPTSSTTVSTQASTTENDKREPLVSDETKDEDSIFDEIVSDFEDL